MKLKKNCIIIDISNIIKKYLICKNNCCQNYGKHKLNTDDWNRDNHNGYYCAKCEREISYERSWVGGSGPGRAFFFQGC